jgi:hypothetical protein
MRRRRDAWFWLAAAVAATTLAAGLVQVAVPGFVLGLVDARRDPTTRHLFAVVGMFMALFGGLLGHVLVRPPDRRTDGLVLAWVAAQKAGACVAVASGVVNDVFGGLAVLVAVNDGASAAVLLWYRRCLAAR